MNFVIDYSLIDTGLMVCSFFISILLCGMVMVSQNRLNKEESRYMISIAVMNFFYTLCFLLEQLLLKMESPDSWVKWTVILLITFEFLLPIVIADLVIMYQAHHLEQKGRIIVWRKYIQWALVIYTIPLIINIFKPFIFYVDEYNQYCSGWFYNIENTMALLMVALLGAVAYLYHEDYRRGEIVYTILYVMIPFVALVIAMINDEIDLVEYATTIGVFLLVLIAETEKFSEYMENEEKMIELRNQMLITQLRPHFLYNALSSISQLCKYDADQAADMTRKFTDFVAKNMEDVKRTAPIPFEKELEYIKNYIAIEKMRFGEDLEVRYHIEEKDFYVPPLVVQPIIENAIKHGLGGREEGGMIIISTQKYPGGHTLSIADDGVGYDEKIQAQKMDDGRVHIGMKSVKERLAQIQHSQYITKSVVGKGTTVMIVIPDTYHP